LRLSTPSRWASDYRDEQELLIQRTIDVLPVEADGEAIIGDPVEQLVALSQCVDLWVVGSRGCGPVSRILLANTPRGWSATPRARR
jgi:hypothetical protein